MCISSTCPNNTSGVGADFFCKCLPRRKAYRKEISETKEIIASLDDYYGWVWDMVFEYFTHE